MSHRSPRRSSRDSTGTSVPFFVTTFARTIALSPSTVSWVYLIRSPPYCSIRAMYVLSSRSAKSWVNSSRSAAVRDAQWRASARLAVSATSKISCAIFRTAARRSWGLSAWSSSTLMTCSLYSRSWSVGDPARAGADTPITSAHARRRAAAFVMIWSIQRHGARARVLPARPRPSSGPGPRRRPPGRRMPRAGGRREDTHLRRAHVQDVDEEQRMGRRLDPAAGAEEERRDQEPPEHVVVPDRRPALANAADGPLPRLRGRRDGQAPLTQARGHPEH